MHFILTSFMAYAYLIILNHELDEGINFASVYIIM